MVRSRHSQGCCRPPPATSRCGPPRAAPHSTRRRWGVGRLWPHTRGSRASRPRLSPLEVLHQCPRWWVGLGERQGAIQGPVAQLSPSPTPPHVKCLLPALLAESPVQTSPPPLSLPKPLALSTLSILCPLVATPAHHCPLLCLHLLSMPCSPHKLIFRRTLISAYPQ